MSYRITSEDKSYCHSTPDFRIAGLPGSYSIGFVAEGREGRQVQDGPKVPGPWGWCNRQATVIDNTGHSHRHFMSLRTVALGEQLEIDGLPGVWHLAIEKPYPAARDEVVLRPGRSV